MPSPQALIELEALKNKLLSQLRTIEETINLFRKEFPTDIQVGESTSNSKGKPSNQQIVIDAVVELIKKVNGRNVTNAEIIDSLKEKDIIFENWKTRGDIDSGVSSILSLEVKKTNGRLRRGGRGLWNLKREKHPFSRETVNHSSSGSDVLIEQKQNNSNGSYATHKVVVETAINIAKNGGSASIDQILQNLENRHIHFEGTTNKRTRVSVILTREEKRKGRIRRVGRSLFDIPR